VCGVNFTENLVTRTGLQTKGFLHMKDPPSKIRMGPKRVVAGGRTSKTGVIIDKAIYAILWSSVIQVLQLLKTLSESCPWRPHPHLSLCSYFKFLIPHFSNSIFLFLVHFSLLFSISFFSFRPDGQILARVISSSQSDFSILARWPKISPASLRFGHYTCVVWSRDFRWKWRLRKW